MTPLKVIYLIRHGHFDIGDARDPTEGKCLFPSGIQQAERTAEYLASCGSKFDRVYSSDYMRARQTADIIASKLVNVPLEIDSDLREIKECYHMGGNSSVLHKLAELDSKSHPAAAVAAFDRYFARLPSTVNREIIVCHGNLITYFLSRLIQLSLFQWKTLSIHYCSITEIHIDSAGESEIISICDESHIPKELQL